MELRDYLKLIGRSWHLVAVATVAVAFIGYYSAVRSKPRYQVVTTFTVTQKPQPPTGAVFTYDSYYSLQATASLTDTIAGLVSSPNTVIAVFQKVGQPLPVTDTRRLARVLRTQKSPGFAATFTAILTHQNEQSGRKLVETLREFITQTVVTYQGQGSLSDDFLVTSSEVAVLKQVTSPRNQTAIFGLVGFIVGVGLVLVREYLA